uniref:Uncharacterized protein n=1 Tax=Acrobeloides nanus TaxID=290746 RepID=A0A914DPK1_9BILA
MVLNNGRPETRPFPPSDAVQHYDLVKFSQLAPDLDLDIRTHNLALLHNLNACRSPKVTKKTLLMYMQQEKRIDIEQAVGLVLSCIPISVAAKAVKHVESMLFNTHMWLDDKATLEEEYLSIDEKRLGRMRQFLSQILKKDIDENDDEFIATLKSLRRNRRKLDHNQRLRFKSKLLDKLDLEERQIWSESWKSAAQTSLGEKENALVISKNNFTRLQKMINRLEGNTSPTGIFVKQVADIEQQVRRSEAQISAVEKSNDIVAIAYSFMALQRRLQCKVVSNNQWTDFLKKGESKEVLQNRPDLVTSFEKELAIHATDLLALNAIRPTPDYGSQQSSSTNTASTLQDNELNRLTFLICRQMRFYVDIFGNGKFENLRYRIGQHGGSNRGPVDSYNLLVDLLQEVKTRATAAKKPITIGPCYKFLAKDIMAWNNAWNDDAFAPGKIPGWFYFLELDKSNDTKYF